MMRSSPLSKAPVAELLVLLVLVMSFFVWPARADVAPKPAPASGQGATTFTEAPTPTEEVSGLGLMVAAYIAMWVLLAAYVTALLMRSRRLDGELHELRARLEQLDRAVQAGTQKRS